MKGQFMVISAVIAGLIMITVGSVIADVQSQTFEPEDTSYDLRYLADEAERLTDDNTPSEMERQNYRKLVMQTDFVTDLEYIQEFNCFDVGLQNPGERYDLWCLGGPETYLDVSFDYAPVHPSPETEVSFQDDTESFAGISSREWYIENSTGNMESVGSGDSVDYQFDESGIYDVRLEVEDNSGESSQHQTSVYVIGSLTWNSTQDWNSAESIDRLTFLDYSETDMTGGQPVSKDVLELGYGSEYIYIGADSTPQAYWPFDETGATAYEMADENSGNGTISGPQTGVAGISGSRSYQFDGTDYVEIEHQPLIEIEDDQDEITYSAWVKPEGSGYRRMIINKEYSFEMALTNENNDNDREFIYAIHTGEENDPGEGWIWQQTDTDVPENEWTHLAVSYDGSEMKGYVNGSEVHSEPKSGSIDEFNNDLRIGWREEETDNEFVGRIDEPMLFYEYREQSFIDELYKVGKNGSVVTGWKEFAGDVDPNNLILNNTQFNLDDETVNVYVQSEEEPDNSESIELEDGDIQYNVPGLNEEESRYRLQIEMESKDPERSPVVDSLSLGLD